ncbi:Predicted membrane protein [Duganella sp. CF458]|uniref:DUF2306 domain-containing protein n=1 Tax=Duganella sp. CF458 TaxID=1884368 RepID=UPI0008EBA2D7|nr:DUF2306 domain-containing protein [Duganella sp. CF458]SFF60256.1 Predicted membrane protein [Duganella sp. CF458]
MTTAAATSFPIPHRVRHTSALKVAAAFWFAVTAVGQSLFVLYILGFHGRALVQGQPEAVNKVLPKGYVPGDLLGNVALFMHIAFAVAIIGGGLLQLLPQLRTIAPRLHRWNGRSYVTLAVVSSLAGMFMMLTRGTVGGPFMYAGMTLDALLVLAFACLTVREARARRFDSHRRWALRLFMAVSAVWFFRVGLMGWLVINGGPVGFDPVSFRGPFLDVLAFAQYLLPLAVLELYFRAQSSRNALASRVMAAGLLAATAFMGVGIFGAAMGMWLPRL